MIFRNRTTFRKLLLAVCALVLATTTFGAVLARQAQPRELSGAVGERCLPCALQNVTGERLPKPGGDDDDEVFDFATGDCLDGGSGCE